MFSQLLVFGTLDRIQKAMEKKEYEKAYEQILKGYEKEPDNPGVSFYHAKLLFDKTYDRSNLDSARIAINDAKKKYSKATQDLIDEITKEEITAEKINLLHDQIRDRAFQNTLENLTIEQALSFQEKFPNSVYNDLLIYKVDSIEFRNARLSNSQRELVQFINEHPVSIFKPKADSILDGLRFFELREKGNLKDYYSFHNDYPFSRHKRKVESFILKASTASHRKERYEEFISHSEIAALKKKAADVLFYSSKKHDYMHHPDQDSIKKILSLANTVLYPVVQNGLYGFFDHQGQSKISSLYSDILPDYKCTLIQDDWVFVKKVNEGLILTKNGEVVLQGIDGYRSVSEDVGLVKRRNQWYLYHKSGFQILDQSVEGAEIIANKWIKVKSKDKWGLFTFLGLQVAEVLYDDISKLESFWIFRKNNLYAVYTEDLILSEIEERGVTLEFKFDDVELVNKNTLIGFKGERECLLDSTLNFLIPWGNYEIYPEDAGWYLKSGNGYRLYNESEADLMDRHYSYLESNDGWLALKTAEDWMLLPRKGALLPSREYDSIKLVNDFVVVLVKDQEKRLQFITGESIKIDEEQIRTFQNKPGYISLFKDDKTTIFDSQGKVVIDGKFHGASFLSDSLIRVQVRDKQGLIHTNGDWVLNPVFNTLDEKDGLVLTLIDGKIGCYDPKINVLITTEYEGRLERLKDYYLAKKNGKFGVIDAAKNEIVPFSYDEIQYWNDTSYLVKRDGLFHIIGEDEESAYDAIDNIQILVNNNEHSIYQFVKNGKYGLMSTQFGELLTPEFTDILNIGSNEDPLIFADQHLDKAGFHVVSYVDEKGKLILSKAYTRDEFDGILCDE